MKCKVCGQEITEGAVFCGSCGWKVEWPTEIEEKAPEEEIIEEESFFHTIQRGPHETENNVQSVESDLKLINNDSINCVEKSNKELAISYCEQLMSVISKMEDKTGNESAIQQELRQQVENLTQENTKLKDKIASLEAALANYKCPNCGADTTSDMKFCNSCGFKLK